MSWMSGISVEPEKVSGKRKIYFMASPKGTGKAKANSKKTQAVSLSNDGGRLWELCGGCRGPFRRLLRSRLWDFF